VPWEKITVLELDRPRRFTLKDGKVINAWFIPIKNQRYALVYQKKPTKILLSDVLQISPLSQEQQDQVGPIWLPAKWKFRLSGGFQYYTGNTDESAINAGFRTSMNSQKTEFEGYVRGAYGLSDGKRDLQQIYSSGKFNWLHTPRFYTTYTVGAEHNAEEDLNFRSYEVVGVGYKIINTPKTELRLEGGFGTSQEYFDNLSAKYFPSALGSILFTQKFGSFIKWINVFHFFPNLKNTEDYRAVIRSELDVIVFKNLGFSLVIEDRFDQTPAPGNKKNDFKIISNVALSF